MLSGALAAVDCVTGVHVCGDGDLGLALESGPQVLGVEVSEALVRDAIALSRFLDGDGWIAWGAIPTDRPVGESADKHWRRLAMVWCELTRRGCDPVPLATRGMITPACGLAGYGASQAERVLGIARGARRSCARPGRCGPPHAGSLNWSRPRTATAVCAVSHSKPAPPCAATAALRSNPPRTTR